jgi:sec-independent protein translocase protein TatA
MLPNLGSGELIIILALGLLVFGAQKIPEIARSFGKSVNSFKAGLKDGVESEPK